MKTVYVASKSNYGNEFCGTFNSLEELKIAIVKEECMFIEDFNIKMYSEKLFNTVSSNYTLYKVELDDTEDIVFSDYDGVSWFNIVKKPKYIVSKKYVIECDKSDVFTSEELCDVAEDALPPVNQFAENWSLDTLKDDSLWINP